VIFLLIVAMAALMLHLRHARCDRDRPVAHERPSDPRKIGLWFAIFVVVSPAILFFLWMASLSVKFEVDNAAYPRCSSPSASPGKTMPTCSPPTASDLLHQQPDGDRHATLLAMLVGVPAATASRGWRRINPRS